MPPHGKLLKLSQPILSLCVHKHVYVIIFYKSKCNELFYHALIEILFKVLTFFFQDVEDSRENFYEGAFLSMLFKKLQRLLDQVFYLIRLIMIKLFILSTSRW